MDQVALRRQQRAVRIAGRNLHTWTKYKGLDPETNLGGAEFLTQGIDFFQNPQTRSFVVAFTLNQVIGVHQRMRNIKLAGAARHGDAGGRLR